MGWDEEGLEDEATSAAGRRIMADQDQWVAFPEDLVTYDELKSKKIPFVPQINVFETAERCTAIPGSDLSSLCNILGIIKENIILHPTNISGMSFAEMPEMPHRKKPSPKASPRKSNAATLRQRYMELCGEEGKAKLVAQLEKEVGRLEGDIAQQQQSLVYIIRLAKRKQDELERLKNDTDKFSARFGDEFDQLMKHPDVKGLDINGVKLSIYTRTIQIEHAGKVYDIGEFEIDVYTDGSNGCINFKNLTRLVDDGRWSHPHINYDGRPCLGNIQDTVPQLIAERKFSALASVLIEYLKSYESTDEYRPYRTIDYWPEAKKEKKGE